MQIELLEIRDHLKKPQSSEILFGGTTRSLIGEARIPMLMSR